MPSRTCVNSKELKRCRESRVSWIFFLIGIISTIAVRVVTVLAHMDPVYGKIAWYVGVFGFFVYFVYKYKVEQARYRLIIKSGLREKTAQGGIMAKEDRELIGSILCALSSNKDRINYLLIFVSSALAILIAVYLDFVRGI